MGWGRGWHATNDGGGVGDGCGGREALRWCHSCAVRGKARGLGQKPGEGGASEKHRVLCVYRRNAPCLQEARDRAATPRLGGGSTRCVAAPPRSLAVAGEEATLRWTTLRPKPLYVMHAPLRVGSLSTAPPHSWPGPPRGWRANQLCALQNQASPRRRRHCRGLGPALGPSRGRQVACGHPAAWRHRLSCSPRRCILPLRRFPCSESPRFYGSVRP